MFGRLVQKELLYHLLDFRFVVVFALCALLSGLSVYVGGRNYARQLREYNTVTENNRRAFQEASLDKGRLFDLIWVGYSWNRRPEALSPLVYGLSGTLGREVRIRYQWFPVFKASTFETDPIHMLFEVLDLAFVAKVVLSLCVLLFTFDAVCGEKEAGTLRLYASFSVPRSTLALAKLAGCTLAVLIPFVFAFLLAAAVLALSQGVGLEGGDWGRVGALMGAFGLYLVVFAAFGLFVSALTHRRMTAFLGLLGLWAIWLFVAPNLALDIAGRMVPVRSFYELEKQARAMQWKSRINARNEIDAYNERNRVENWDALSEAQREQIGMAYREARYQIETRWDTEYHSDLRNAQAGWRNRMRRQHQLGVTLSAISPLGAVNFLSMDLARTGFVQQERIEGALNTYLISMGQFVHEKRRETFDTFRGVDLSDFTWFTYRDTETLGECLGRNMFHILNLALLAVLGFAGAYVAILRYDVR